MMKNIFQAVLACSILLAGLTTRLAAEEKLVLGYTNLQSSKILVPLGADAGIFRKYGIDLTMFRVTPGHTAIPKLLAREIDIFLGNGAPVVNAVVAQGAPLVIIASLGGDGFQLITQASIRSASDLKGKRIGVSSPGSSADRIARLALKQLAIDPDHDVTMVATGLNRSAARLELVVKGEIDATIVSAENVIALGERRTKVFSLADLEDLGVHVSGSDISVARRLIETRRSAVIGFLRALIESIARAKADADLARDAYRRHGGVKNADALEWRVREFLQTKVPSVPYPNERAIVYYLADAGKEGFSGEVTDVGLVREAAAGRR